MGQGSDGNGGQAPGSRTARLVGVGCLTSVAGAASGGMIAVLVAKIVGSLRGCVPPPGPPACNAGTYWVIGAALGLVTLPALAVWRLRQHGAAPRNSQRG